MKKVLLSVNPKWVAKICNKIGERDGKPIYEKRVEVRKTKPKAKTPFTVLIYETMGRTETPFVDEEGHHIFKGRGQVIGEFVCDKVTKAVEGDYGKYLFESETQIDVLDLLDYATNKNDELVPLYGWHISDLVIYDKPRELSEFAAVCEGLKPYQCDKCVYYFYENTEDGAYDECCCNNLKPITRPPQSWCYVEERE